MMRFNWICMPLLAFALEGFAAKIIGDESEDTLFGTPYADTFYGGDGADTFVINFLSETPDEILDFDPQEGDQIELTFPELRDFGDLGDIKLESGRFKVNRRGVVTVNLGAGDVPVVDARRTGMKLELDQRKGRFLLKFEIPIGGP
ncbi:MAG: calcium-binding protein [Pseudomonadales bacterium]|nr:calcium-binding protein [Pseudomonadales bacterium]MBO7005401.1 calcium-binding protein [Pseudomonadales bacterium]